MIDPDNSDRNMIGDPYYAGAGDDVFIALDDFVEILMIVAYCN